jgi:hypothetical protein
MADRRGRIGPATHTRSDGALRVRELIESLNRVYESSNFVAGDSPAIHSYLADAGYNAINSWVVCDGPGDIRVSYSRDAVNYGEAWRLRQGEMLNLSSFDVATIKITHTGVDSSYRVFMV